MGGKYDINIQKFIFVLVAVVFLEWVVSFVLFDHNVMIDIISHYFILLLFFIAAYVFMVEYYGTYV